MSLYNDDKLATLNKLSTDGITLSRTYRQLTKQHAPTVTTRYWTYYCQWNEANRNFTVGIIDRGTRDWIFAVTNEDILTASLQFNSGLTSVIDTYNRIYTLGIGLTESEPAVDSGRPEGAQ